jgi:hypothetical protein
MYWKSATHKQRFLAIMQQIGKVFDGRVDPEYGAALYILTSDASMWEQASKYVERNAIRIEDLLSEVDFSHGYEVLIKLAANLFNELNEAGQQVRPVDLMILDEENFQVALAALQIRYSSLRVDDVKA